MRRLAGALVSLVRRSFNFAAPPQALAIEHAFDAPSVREAVILRLLDRVHAGERVAETFALGTAYRSNRLVQASLGQFDGKRRAESASVDRPRALRHDPARAAAGVLRGALRCAPAHRLAMPSAD
jgi:hypothetical protein